MTRMAMMFSVLLLLVPGCGSDDGGGDGDGDGDGDGSGSTSGGTTCSCECACCVAIGDCDTPQTIEAKDAAECEDKCSTDCNGSFSNSYDCS